MISATEAPTAHPAHYRSGFVALAGVPNVGKSTLLNALVGTRLSIVSARPQTTRVPVAGIWTGTDCQIVFIDAPGLLEPRYPLQEAMRWAADRALEEADVVAFVADATRPETFPDESLLAVVDSSSTPAIVLINKCDAADDEVTAEMLGRARARGYESLPISATTGAGLDELRERLAELLPESPPLYPTDHTSSQNLRFFAEEFVRETCMELFEEEIPYSIACRVEEFRESEDPVYIRITIFVERESQKGIVIGRGGSAIKRVGAMARRKIESLVGERVYLDLHVKVMPNWSRKASRLRHLGFRVPRDSRYGRSSG